MHPRPAARSSDTLRAREAPWALTRRANPRGALNLGRLLETPCMPTASTESDVDVDALPDTYHPRSLDEYIAMFNGAFGWPGRFIPGCGPVDLGGGRGSAQAAIDIAPETSSL